METSERALLLKSDKVLRLMRMYDPSRQHEANLERHYVKMDAFNAMAEEYFYGVSDLILGNVAMTSQEKQEWEHSVITLEAKIIAYTVAMNAKVAALRRTSTGLTNTSFSVPEYDEADAEGVAKYEESCEIGFDLWQAKSGTTFNNVIITDDLAAAKNASEDFLAVTKEAEKTMKEVQDEEERKKADDEGKNDEAMMMEIFAEFTVDGIVQLFPRAEVQKNKLTADAPVLMAAAVSQNPEGDDSSDNGHSSCVDRDSSYNNGDAESDSDDEIQYDEEHRLDPGGD